MHDSTGGMSRLRRRAGGSVLLALAWLVTPIGAGDPASGWVSGPADADTYTIELNVPGFGNGSCEIGYYLGPNGGVEALGTTVGASSVRSQVFAENCSGDGVPHSLFAYASGVCSDHDSWIAGWSTGDEEVAASCTASNSSTASLTSYDTGRYTASYELSLNVFAGANTTINMTNSVPGCSKTSPLSISCQWNASFRAQDPL